MKKFLVLVCIVFGLVFLYRSNINQELNKNMDNEIYKLKTEYLGNASNTGKIINSINWDESLKFLNFAFDKDSNKNILNLYFEQGENDLAKLPSSFVESINKNSALIFALIGNLDRININTSDKTIFSSDRSLLDKKGVFKNKLDYYLENKENFKDFLSELENIKSEAFIEK